MSTTKYIDVNHKEYGVLVAAYSVSDGKVSLETLGLKDDVNLHKSDLDKKLVHEVEKLIINKL